MAQLEQLSEFLKRKKDIYRQYVNAMETIEGLSIAAPPDYADNNHWMNVLQIDNAVYDEDRDSIMQRLEKNRIQTRPVWALNHLQKPSERQNKVYLIIFYPFISCKSFKLLAI